MSKSKKQDDNKVPLYRKIKDYILDKIHTGEWQVHQKILSENELGAQFNTSRMTVNRALRELTAEGRLVRKQGNGTFVAPTKVQSALLDITSIASDIKKAGGKYTCNTHLLCEEKAAPDIAAKMKIKPYTPLFHSILVHNNNGVPIQLADRLVNPAVAPHYLDQDFNKLSTTEYLLAVAPVSKIEHVVEALIPPAWIRELLKISAAEPCLALNRMTWTNEIIATKSCFYYPGSRYSLGGQFCTSSAGNILVV
jgi:GntR family transcriptional regulator, histidine utilization repressor